MFPLRNVHLCVQQTIMRGTLNFFFKRSVLGMSNMSKRCFCQDKKDPSSKCAVNLDIDGVSYSKSKKFEQFKDEDSPVILDVFEERFKALQFETEPVDEYSGINLERGVEGVFDIEDIVDVLRKEKAEHIFVVKIPAEMKYVDYIVVVSGKSSRHMKSMAEFIRKVYKQKKHDRDLIPKIEGEDSKDWIAMDLGNIALHIFSEETREMYDLESLWSLGAKFDEKSQQAEDPLVQLLQKYSMYLGDYKPVSNGQ